MNDGFLGLNIAVRGLYTAQRGLDVVSHNISNVNTPGYSRQKTVQNASNPTALYDGTGMVGTGSEVTSVDRIRDEYLDFKYWSENVAYGEWETKRTLLEDIEATFNEPSDSGFTTVINNFYDSIQELAKDPSSPATRSLVRENGVTVSKYFNNIANHFEKLQSDSNYQIRTKVDKVNSLATQIRQVNSQIFSYELDGSNANDLRDKRTSLVDQLSKLVNIEASEVVAGKLPSGKDDKHFVITISGKAIVDHFNISKLAYPQRTTKLNDEDVENLYDVKWEDGNSLQIKGGELKGLLDIRDGNDGVNGTPIYKGIPHYLKKLNEFVRKYALSFNEGIIADQKSTGHADGYKLNSTTGDNPSGVRFFTMTGVDGKSIDSKTFINGATTVSDIKNEYMNITAKNFTVSSDIVADYNNVSISDKAGEKGNCNNLNNILAMRNNSHMFEEGAPEDFMKSVVATLGIDSQQAVRLSDSQDRYVKQVENNRISDSGVSVDEEMANLIKYQHAYNAAAKMITTMQEIYETLVNKLGV